MHPALRRARQYAKTKRHERKRPPTEAARRDQRRLIERRNYSLRVASLTLKMQAFLGWFGGRLLDFCQPHWEAADRAGRTLSLKLRNLLLISIRHGCFPRQT